MNKLAILALLVQVQTEKPPNVCRNFVDYLTMDRRNCWYNPDVDLSPPDVVKRHGYPLERYDAETEDGYILTTFRMPRENPKGIVLMQPPSFCTFSGWIDKGKNDSLGFLLYDAGYDVWLGNPRGSKYSRKHKDIDANEFRFWNFSFHEMGKYDIPAQVDLIVNTTGGAPGGISIVSFSLGSTASVVYATIRPDHSRTWINSMILMAPSTSLQDIFSVDRELSRSVNNIERMASEMKLGGILTRNYFIHNLLKICNGPLIMVCLVGSLLTMGNVPEELPPQWIPVMFSQNPSGVSLKTFLHYMQIANSAQFQLYDYGKEKNEEYYHSDLPPKYPMDDIQVPIVQINGESDILTTPTASANFFEELPAKAKIYGSMMIPNFSHLAFYYGRTTATKVYKPIVRLLDKIYKQQKTGNN